MPIANRRAVKFRYAVLAAVIGLVLAAMAPASAAARTRHDPPPVPQGFFGVDASLTAGAAPGPQFDSMVANGVQSVRLEFYWGAMQPYASFAKVPANQRRSFVNAGGVPTTFAGSDQQVALAASHGFSVMAVVLSAPNWDSKPRGSYVRVPLRDGPYGNFMKALIHRYGPKGSFWKQYPHLPRHPIRLWTIWNEPNFGYNWGPQPFVHSYVALLRVAHAAIKSADPGAKVILAGVANYSWTTLQQIYSIRGARGLFDVVDIHPYTKNPSGVIEIIRRVRATMARNRDAHKPIIVGEYTWPSSAGQGATGVFDTQTTEAGQASKLRTMLPLFAKYRQQFKLLGVYYFTWITHEYKGEETFGFAGLVAERDFGPALHIVAKPALAAFRTSVLKLEHCKQKGKLATICLRPGS